MTHRAVPPHMFIVSLVFGIAMTAAEPSVAQAPTLNLLNHGDFTAVGPGAIPSAWQITLENENITLPTEGGNRFLRLTSPAGVSVATHLTLSLQPGWKQVAISSRMRVTGLVVGSADYMTAMVDITFYDAAGSSVRAPDEWVTPRVQRDVDWTVLEVIRTVPPTAVRLELSPSIISARGTADFDDLVVRVVATR